MDSEIKLVTRQETFNDLAVRELAKNRAACMCRIQFKRCSKKACCSCSSYVKYKHCIEQMSEYDQLRLNSYIAEYYLAYSADPDVWMSHDRFVSYYVKFFIVVVLGFLLIGLFFGVMSDMYANPRDRPKDIMHESIVSLIKETQAKVTDLNKDGLVNCIDHAVLFKMCWDNAYPLNKSKCIIVRNKNPDTKMHHLFNRIYYKEKTIDVEPWAIDPWFYKMEDVWGDTYNPHYNYYGETQQWLDEVK